MAGVGTAITTTTPCITVSGIYPAFDASTSPITPGSTGIRYFGTTEGGTVYQNLTATITFDPATRNPSAGSTPIQ
jgi:hypothetical protein